MIWLVWTLSPGQVAMVEKHYKLLVVRQKSVIPFTFGLLLIHSPSKHNGHLLMDCTSTHFINSQCKIVLYRFLKNLSLELCMANCMFNPLPWKSVSLIKFVRISVLTTLFTFGLFWHSTGNLPNNDLRDYGEIMGDPLRGDWCQKSGRMTLFICIPHQKYTFLL